MSKKQLDKLLAEGDPEAGGIIHSAIEEFAQTLTSVIKRFLKVAAGATRRPSSSAAAFVRAASASWRSAAPRCCSNPKTTRSSWS